MKMYDIISKKKSGAELSREEINFFVKGYTDGSVPDYQVSALLMAICFAGMSDAETYSLTNAIQHSGDCVDLSELGNLSVDKHSTGGVGDKTTLIVTPLAAAVGCKVAKMSGRGLGHTGGTVDKLESIPGYRISLAPDEFIEQVKEIGVAVIGQSGNLAPADKKIYALRDVTATVDSIPLITSSIMGKKLAAGSHSIVLDVKCGSGAFVKTADEAELLARSMVKIGKMCGRETTALITDMDTPLGYAIGNILEVKEAIDVLCGRGPDDLVDVCISLAAAMAELSLKISAQDAKERVTCALKSGAALAKFKEWIGAQGGDVAFIDNTELFARSAFVHEVKAKSQGFISGMNAESIGLCAMNLGAGRSTKDENIDYSAGIILKKKTQDYVRIGDTLAVLYTNSPAAIEETERLFLSAISLTDTPCDKKPLIYKLIK